MKRGTEEILDRYLARYDFVRREEGPVREAVGVLERSFRGGGKLLLCGNGGSCADADHIMGELVKGFRMRRPLDEQTHRALCQMPGAEELADALEGGLPAIDLGAPSALVTAMINDVGGQFVFAQQVVGLGRPGDVLFGISTSGNSQDILFAGAAARAKGLQTIGLTGRNGGKMGEQFDLLIRSDADITEDVQDQHTVFYHVLCAMLENQFWGE